MTIEALKGLKPGLDILEPFLKRHDFGFDNYENFKSSSGQFTFARYRNERKQFILGYHFSVGQVVYQYDNLQLSHDLYLDQLGFSGKKQLKDIQTDNKLLAFNHILHDFKFLVEDFFEGECFKLKEFSKLPDNIITEYDKKAREGYNLQFDKLRIDKAREEFGKKAFKKSLEIYRTVEYKNLINDLDKSIIAYCERHIARHI